MLSTQYGQMGRGSEVQEFASSPLMEEALECPSMLQQALSSNIESLRVFSDNQTLVRAINSNLMDKEIVGVVFDIKSLSDLFVSISFSYVSRSDNLDADRLEKKVMHDPSSASTLFLSHASDSILGHVMG